MWHLGIRKDATLILLVAVFVVLSINILFILMRYQEPTRCTDASYNPALITGHE